MAAVLILHRSAPREALAGLFSCAFEVPLWVATGFGIALAAAERCTTADSGFGSLFEAIGARPRARQNYPQVPAQPRIAFRP